MRFYGFAVMWLCGFTVMGFYGYEVMWFYGYRVCTVMGRVEYKNNKVNESFKM